MKRLLYPVILLLILALPVSADQSQWWLSLTASNASGQFYTTCDIGWDFGYTDGVDVDHPLYGTELLNPPGAPLGGTLAVAAAVLPGDQLSLSDNREPASENTSGPKVWDILVYYQQNNSATVIDPIKVSVETHEFYEYDYAFGPLIISAPEALGDVKEWVFTDASPLSDFSFNVPGRLGQSQAVALSVQAGNTSAPVPEPGGILALSAGLVGLFTQVVRRRR